MPISGWLELITSKKAALSELIAELRSGGGEQVDELVPDGSSFFELLSGRNQHLAVSGLSRIDFYELAQLGVSLDRFDHDWYLQVSLPRNSWQGSSDIRAVVQCAKDSLSRAT
jgi:hypothetical protein